MQFTMIVAVSAHVASVLLICWMTVQIHRHLRRIEHRLAVLEHDTGQVPAVARPAPASALARRQSDPRLPEFPHEPRQGRTSHAAEPNVRGTRGIA